MLNERKIGKIYDYDGVSGYIITNDLNYPFSNKDIYKDAKNSDIVSFVPNLVVFGDEKVYVAKFIEKYNLENEKIKIISNDK